jgi:2-(1,2-epoxy-1,2-dihydrophenyl)acetyl-CoA isomerase
MADLLRSERDDDVLVLTMNDPARRNALSIELTTGITEAIRDNADAGAIVLLAEGAHFCVGGDVSAFAAADDTAEYVGRLAESFHELVRTMRAASAPVIVGARGWAAGAGMSIVLAADVVVAGQSVKLRPAYTRIGMTPDGGMTWTLPRMVGQRLARSILFGNQVLTAQTALEIGIIDDVVADDVVDRQAVAFARRLTDGPVAALAGIKRLLHDGASRTLDEQLDAEAASIAASAGGPEGQEGIAAFAERRAPDFRGARKVPAGISLPLR